MSLLEYLKIVGMFVLIVASAVFIVTIIVIIVSRIASLFYDIIYGIRRN